MQKVSLCALGGSLPSVRREGSCCPPARVSDTRLPASPDAGTHAAEETASSPAILVVDDSPTVRKIVETTLRREGYEVLTFPDGIAALTWLAERSDAAPRLLLLDIELPKLDGYALARALKAKPACARATIVLMSRRDGVVDRLKGRLAGARASLTKPFTTQALLDLVRQAFDGQIEGRGE